MVTVSERRLEANRRNAARSPGPRTPEGKAVVALNAMKHGLLSREVPVRRLQLPTSFHTESMSCRRPPDRVPLCRAV
jgi:hypothetical protein